MNLERIENISVNRSSVNRQRTPQTEQVGKCLRYPRLKAYDWVGILKKSGLTSPTEDVYHKAHETI